MRFDEIDLPNGRAYVICRDDIMAKLLTINAGQHPNAEWYIRDINKVRKGSSLSYRPYTFKSGARLIVESHMRRARFQIIGNRTDGTDVGLAIAELKMWKASLIAAKLQHEFQQNFDFK